MAPIGFLDLPAELRNEIYADVFTSVPKPLYHPWNEGRSCETYLSLFLTCRQVYSEASSLLWKAHSEDITLHFESGNDLMSFVQHDLLRWPQLHSARFRLRITVPDKDNLTAQAEHLAHVKHLTLKPSYQPILWECLELRRLTAVLFWKNMQRSATASCYYQYRDVECSGCGDRSCTGSWRASKPFTNEAGFTMTLFTWDDWLGEEAKDADAKRAEYLATMPLKNDMGFPQEHSRPMSLGSAYYRAREKITRECVVLEGRIGDVKLTDPPTDEPDLQSLVAD